MSEPLETQEQYQARYSRRELWAKIAGIETDFLSGTETVQAIYPGPPQPFMYDKPVIYLELAFKHRRATIGRIKVLFQDSEEMNNFERMVDEYLRELANLN